MNPPGALRGSSGRPYLLLTLATAMWGANAVAARLAVGEVSPMALTCLRWLVVVLALSLLAGRRLAADLRTATPHWRFIVLCGALGFTAFNAIFYLAGHMTSAIDIGLIQGIIPALVLAGGVVLDRTPVRPLQVAGLLLTLVGVLVATSRGDPQVLRHLAFNEGDIWMIGASILYAGYSLALRRRPPIPPLAFFAAAAAAAFVTSVPLFLFEIVGGGAIWPTPLGWAIVAFVGIGPSLLGQLFYMRGVELIGPGRASIFMNLIPIFAALSGVLIVRERFGLHHAAALALVLGGIWGRAARRARRVGGTGVTSAISISGLSKTYASGYKALKAVDLEVRRGEIFALLGPNGAGKTTLISIVCGIVNASTGTVRVDGHDIVSAYRMAREAVGLVPQELTTDAFETVLATVNFSRGLFGKRRDPSHVESVLRDLSLWDRRDSKIITLSGGMKRRLMIAKALSHEPRILFLDEPTAGVDVELRRDMWEIVRRLRASGVTIVLTTHYIEEAEEMADRIGVIDKGELILVEEKTALLEKLGRKKLTMELAAPLERLPTDLEGRGLSLARDGAELVYTYDTARERSGVATLLQDLREAGIAFKDLRTEQTSLEEIFVGLVSHRS